MKLCWSFTFTFYTVLNEAFSRISTISTGSNDGLKLGKLLNLIKYIANETRQFLIAVKLRKGYFLKCRAFLF